MLTIFRSEAQGLVELATAAPGCWIHVVAPTPEESARLHDEFGIPQSFITASLDADELARTDQEDGSTLNIVLVPHVYSEDPTDVPFNTTPLGIIVTGAYLFTVSRVRTNLVSDFSRRYARSISTEKRNRLILQLFLAIAQQYLIFLRQIESQTDAIQRRVQVSLKNKELLELLRFQKSYIYFRQSLESNGLMMRRLQRSPLLEISSTDQELLEDAITENTQAAEVTKISSDILNQMMDAYASIISNNLNDVMKILAIATIILSVPTVLASLYGMNVPLPGQGSPYAFVTILVLTLALIALTSVFFWRRHWL